MQRRRSSRDNRRLKFRSGNPSLVILLSTAILCCGCRTSLTQTSISDFGKNHAFVERAIAEVVQQSQHPDTSIPDSDNAASTPEPRTLTSPLPEDDDSKYWDLSLQEAIQYGLKNSRVLNDLGGTILRAPDAVASNLMSAIVQTDANLRDVSAKTKCPVFRGELRTK